MDKSSVIACSSLDDKILRNLMQEAVREISQELGEKDFELGLMVMTLGKTIVDASMKKISEFAKEHSEPMSEEKLQEYVKRTYKERKDS